MQALRGPGRGESLRLPVIVLLVLLGVLSMHGGASAAPPMTRSAPVMGGDHHAVGDPQPAEPGHHQDAHVVDPCVAKLSTAVPTVPPPAVAVFAGTPPIPTAVGDLRQQREARAGPDVDLHSLCISRT